VGVAVPEFGLTVAVKVTESPYVDGLFEDITAVVVGRLVKVTVAVCVMVTESDASVAV